MTHCILKAEGKVVIAYSAHNFVPLAKYFGGKRQKFDEWFFCPWFYLWHGWLAGWGRMESDWGPSRPHPVKPVSTAAYFGQKPFDWRQIERMIFTLGNCCSNNFGKRAIFGRPLSTQLVSGFEKNFWPKMCVHLLFRLHTIILFSSSLELLYLYLSIGWSSSLWSFGQKFPTKATV